MQQHEIKLNLNAYTITEMFQVSDEVIEKIRNAVNSLDDELRSGKIVSRILVIQTIYTSIESKGSPNELMYASYIVGRIIESLEYNYKVINVNLSNN